MIIINCLNLLYKLSQIESEIQNIEEELIRRGKVSEIHKEKETLKKLIEEKLEH